MIYNLGHAVFEFIESKWGKEGMRQYLFALRKSVIGGGEDAYEEAFKISADDFDQQFDKYLKDRFKPFRDKERPADYGRNLAPDPEKHDVQQRATPSSRHPRATCSPSPPATARTARWTSSWCRPRTARSSENLTKGFDQDLRLRVPRHAGRPLDHGARGCRGRPTATTSRYFVRAEKSRTLILQNVLTRKIEERIDMRTVDDPESPDISPDGRRVVFAALQGGTGDIFIVDLATEEVTNVTKDEFADSGADLVAGRPARSSTSRASASNEKLFRARPRHRPQDADHLRHPRRWRRAVPRRRTRSSSRPPPPTRRSRSIPTWRATATSTTSGR